MDKMIRQVCASKVTWGGVFTDEPRLVNLSEEGLGTGRHFTPPFSPLVNVQDFPF